MTCKVTKKREENQRIILFIAFFLKKFAFRLKMLYLCTGYENARSY